MGNLLFVVLALSAVFLGMVNRRAFVPLVILLAGIPVSLLTGDTPYFAALGGMSGQAAWLFAIVAGCLAAFFGYFSRLHQILGTRPDFLLFLLFATASLSWSVSLLDGLRMLAKYAAPMLIFWVIIAMQPDERLSRRLENTLYLSCALAGLLAFVNTLGGGAIAPLPLKHGIFGLPALSTPYSSPANFSFLMLCGGLMAYCRFLQSRRWLHVLLAGFLLTCVALAFVRISMAATVLGIVAVHLVRARAILTPVFLAVAALLASLIVTSEAFMDRMFFVPERVQWSDALVAPEKFMANVNTSGRTLLWARAQRAFAGESAWVGAGVGAVDAWINTGDSFSSELHSEVYRIRLELGWLGLAIYLTGLLGLWWTLVRAARRASREHLTASLRASGALIPVYLLTLLTDNTLNYAAGFGVLVYGFSGIALVQLRAARVERAAGTRAMGSQRVPVDAMQAG